DVRGTCADVFPRDVFSSEALDELSVSTKYSFPLICPVVANDDRLPSAERQPCQGVLVGHGTGKTQAISEGFLFGVVIPESCTAKRRNENGAVNHDNAVIASRLVCAYHDALVAIHPFFGSLHFTSFMIYMLARKVVNSTSDSGAESCMRKSEEHCFGL